MCCVNCGASVCPVGGPFYNPGKMNLNHSVSYTLLTTNLGVVMDLPNELLHMILEFLPNNEQWSKFRQSSVRIYSLPTVREERSRYIGKIREMKRYEVAVKKVIEEELICYVCFQIFTRSHNGHLLDTCYCEICHHTICDDCGDNVCCVRCPSKTCVDEVNGYCVICLDANPHLCCNYCMGEVLPIYNLPKNESKSLNILHSTNY